MAFGCIATTSDHSVINDVAYMSLILHANSRMVSPGYSLELMVDILFNASYTTQLKTPLGIGKR